MNPIDPEPDDREPHDGQAPVNPSPEQPPFSADATPESADPTPESGELDLSDPMSDLPEPDLPEPDLPEPASDPLAPAGHDEPTRSGDAILPESESEIEVMRQEHVPVGPDGATMSGERSGGGIEMAIDEPASENESVVDAQQTDPSATQTCCPRCDRKLPPDSPVQLCPYCLLSSETCEPTAAWSGMANSPQFQPPLVEELQPFFETLEIGPLIGFGGMGAVYRAHQHSLGRDVALKVLLPEVAAAEGFTDRFLREARALARLGHPNVVAVFDHGRAGPYAFLVMELVEAINLRELMAGERLPAEDALRIVPQLCDALQFAHSRGVVHRDIKPENILIDETGHVKITDFGLAKLGESDQRFGRTATRQVMGTVHYMAPEQIERPREVDHRADLYSLGVVFYELLTGELPLGRFSPPSQKAGTNRQVDHVVLKSLEKEPDRRYASADEVRSDLDRSSTGHARAAASAVDQKVRQATRAVRDAAAAGWHPSWTGVVVTIATAVLYLFVAIGVTAAFNVRDPGVLIFIVTAIAWLGCFFLTRAYEKTPLPEIFRPASVPITWFGRLPRTLFDKCRRGAKSIDGLRTPWLIAGWIAVAFAVCFLIGSLAEDDDLFVGTMIAAPIGWFCTRMALTQKSDIESNAAKLVTFPPVLLTIIPIVLIALCWPAVAWIAMAIQERPPVWFGNVVGLEQNPDGSWEQSMRSLQGKIFGGATFQLGWLSMLSVWGALFPDATRWIARPVLDSWTGRGRWWIATICLALAATSALIWSM